MSTFIFSKAYLPIELHLKSSPQAFTWVWLDEYQPSSHQFQIPCAYGGRELEKLEKSHEDVHYETKLSASASVGVQIKRHIVSSFDFSFCTNLRASWSQ